MFWIGALLVMTAACLFGTMGPVERDLFGMGITPVAVSLVRATLATALLICYALVRRRNLRHSLLDRLPLRILNGLFGIVGIYVGANMGFLRIPVALGIVIFYSAPFWVLVLAQIWGKEHLTLTRLTALGLALAGIWIALGGGTGPVRYDPVGIAAMAVSGFSYAILILNGRYGIGSTDPFGNYLSTFFWGTVLLWLLAVPMGELTCLLNAPAAAWPGLVYLSLLPSLAGYGILLLALKFIPGGPASILSTTEILFAALWGWVLLGETPDRATWAGAALVILAVTLISRAERSDSRQIRPSGVLRGARKKS